MKGEWRHHHALLVVAVLVIGLALTASACLVSSDPETTSSTDTTDSVDVPMADFRLVMADATRLPPSAPEGHVQSVAESIELFGADLYALLAQQAGSGNIVFSPASIVTALAMTYVGAAGTTAEEMVATLHLTLEGDIAHQAFNSLDSALESRSWQETNAEGDTEGVLVKTANSLWAQQGLTFEQDFLDTLAENYGAGMRLVDYVTDAEAARLAINKWVSDQTEDKIPELIAQGLLDELTRLVLVNAVYLDATWAAQFDPTDTADGDFTTLAGNQITTSMMNQTEDLPYAVGENWKAVELPYVRDELAMLLVVPDSSAFGDVEAELANGLFDTVVGGLVSGYEVDLTMPKFEFSTQSALNVPLLELGMTTPFDPSAADFSGMTTQEKLYISDVVHEAYISVDEEGTEAAAATGVIMDLTAAPTQPVELTVDRPFIFALRDRETGAILFMGRVTDPTKE